MNDGPANSDQWISAPPCQVDWHHSENILVSGAFVRWRVPHQSDRGLIAFVSGAASLWLLQVIEQRCEQQSRNDSAASSRACDAPEVSRRTSDSPAVGQPELIRLAGRGLRKAFRVAGPNVSCRKQEAVSRSGLSAIRARWTRHGPSCPPFWQPGPH